MKYHGIALIALTLISSPCSAEVIDGPANIRASPNGVVLFSLDDGVRVQLRKTDGGWSEIAVPVRIDPRRDFADTEMNAVKKGTMLHDESGRTIGVTLDRVKTLPGEEIGSETDITVLIGGYTHRQNIRPESILEPQLAALLSDGKSLFKNMFITHLEEFQYEEWVSKDGFTSYVSFNKPTTDPSPWPRAILFFYEDSLIAVYHERTITSERIAYSVRIRDATMSYVTDVREPLRRKFSEMYYPIIENSD